MSTFVKNILQKVKIDGQKKSIKNTTINLPKKVSESIKIDKYCAYSNVKHEFCEKWQKCKNYYVPPAQGFFLCQKNAFSQTRPLKYHKCGLNLGFSIQLVNKKVEKFIEKTALTNDLIGKI